MRADADASVAVIESFVVTLAKKARGLGQLIALARHWTACWLTGSCGVPTIHRSAMLWPMACYCGLCFSPPISVSPPARHRLTVNATFLFLSMYFVFLSRLSSFLPQCVQKLGLYYYDLQDHSGNRSLSVSMFTPCKETRNVRTMKGPCSSMLGSIRWASSIPSTNKSITRLSKAGELLSARNVFDRMTHKDVVTWNSMMSAYARDGQHGEVLRLFSHMFSDATTPTLTTLSTVLSSCAELGALVEGKQLHGLSIKSSSSDNVFVGTSVITMYSKCGSFNCLRPAFDEISFKSTAAWNALLSGYICNQRILEARELFDMMPVRNVISWTAIINGYAKAGKMELAFHLFDSMPVRNSVTWVVVLGGLVSNEQFESVIPLFNNMLSFGVRASADSIMHVIAACSGLKSSKLGEAIHGYVHRSGFGSNESIEASLVFMYFRCLDIEAAELVANKLGCKFAGSQNSLIRCYIDNNMMDKAQKLFDKMNNKNEASWSLMINGYLRYNKVNSALDLFFTMPEPTIKAYTIIVSGLVESGRLKEARQMFDKMPHKDVMAYTIFISGYMDNGLLEDALDLFRRTPEPNVVTYNVILSGLVQHGKVMEAYGLFTKSPVRDIVSWSTIISALVQSGYSDHALLLFRMMMSFDVIPNDGIIACILSSSASLSLLIQGELVHGLAVKFGYESCLLVSNSLINMYSKCGEVFIAKAVFDLMHEHDIVTWNSMIYGYAINGFGSEGIYLFETMKATGLKPDDVTFLCLLYACMHKCLLEEAYCYFDLMSSEHGIQPNLPHYACMVDLLCRVGQLEKAEKLIYSMPFRPDSAIWTNILKGCRLSSKLHLAEHAAGQLFVLVPGDPTPYLLLSRIYARNGRLTDLQRLQNEMSTVRIIQRPGCSWIEINGQVYSFYAGDRLYCLYGNVFTYLKGLMSKIKEIGYIPDYNLVVEEMDDQEKEEILLQHSEKIAVAFGLLETNYPKPVRIIKNLCICDDCHFAMKLISLHTKREIVVRDTVRFHHFKGGFCSCADSW